MTEAPLGPGGTDLVNGSSRRSPRRRRRDQVRVLLAACGVLGIGAVGTLAAWTDQSTATTGTFSTGRIDIKLGSTPVDNNPPAFTTSFTLTSMKPGDSKDTTLQVNNSGTVPFTYTISGTATNNGAGTDQLGSAMTIQIYAGSTCSGTALNSPTKFTFSATSARALAGGANETLCFRATLPTTADSALQSQTTTGTFTFVATSS
jgi:predicted ribosomally synthesized peptide with SipW-like signal peptide